MEVGGAEMLAKEIAEAGRGRFRFVFACLDSIGALEKELSESRIPVEVLNRRPGVDFRCVVRLRHFLNSHNVDVIHAHQCGPYRYAALARVIGRRIPIILTDHGRPQNDGTSWRRRFANRLLLRTCDQIVAVGRCLVSPLVEHEGFPQEQIEILYNGRDLMRYRSAASDRTTVRHELGLKHDDFVTMQVARLSEEKDHSTCIRAIRRVTNSQPQIRHVIVGDGPLKDELSRQVMQAGLPEQVILLGARHDVPRLLSAADAFILTSVTEAIPLTVIEAMGASLPCIASEVGGVPEVIVPDVSGLLVAPRDDAGFAQAIKNLMDNPTLRCSMGKAARQRAEQLFTHRTMIDSYFRLYDDAMHAREKHASVRWSR